MAAAGQHGTRSAGDPAESVQEWDRRRDRRTLAALFLGVWLVFLLTATYDGFQINDSRETAISSWSLATRGTFALPDGWADDLSWARPGEDGRDYTNRFPGAILTGVPFYAAADLFGLVDEPSRPAHLNYAPAGVAAATVAALTVACLFAAFRLLADRRLAVGAALVIAFGTATWSISADALWTHGPGSLGLAAGILLAARARNAWSGLAFAGAILSRPQLAVVPAVVGLWRGWDRRSLRPVVMIGITSALGVAFLSIYSRVIFGTWLPIAGYGSQKVAAVATTSAGDTWERVFNTLAHRQRGVLVYSPFLLVMLPFVWRGWRIAPAWVRSSAVAGLAYLLVQLRSNDWAGGGQFFGSRLTVETLVLLSPLLLRTYQAVFVRERLLRRVLFAFIGLSFAIHAVGATVLSLNADGRAAWNLRLEWVCETYPDIEECAAPD